LFSDSIENPADIFASGENSVTVEKTSTGWKLPSNLDLPYNAPLANNTRTAPRSLGFLLIETKTIPKQ
jgi:hypothetical protein